MHILTIPEGISEPIPIGGGQDMQAGRDYLCGNAFAGAVMASNWRVMINEQMWALSPLLKAKRYPDILPEKIEDVRGKHIWLMRGGGYGDLLMMTPLIIRLIEKEAIVHVAHGDIYSGIHYGLNIIEETMPIDLAEAEIDYIASFEGWIEGHPDAEKFHMAQQFANKFGIELEFDERKPYYKVTDGEREWAKDRYPKGDRKRIGIQWMASAFYRSYRQIGKVAEMLADKHNCEVILFGHPNQLTTKDDSPLINTTKPPGLTFRQSCALAETCDCIVSPDSAMVHVAAALEVPCVGLYGPFPAELRGTGNKMRAMQGVAPCSPCFYHANQMTDFPAGMPCQKTGSCVALDQIPAELVVETVINLASPIIAAKF